MRLIVVCSKPVRQNSHALDQFSNWLLSWPWNGRRLVSRLAISLLLLSAMLSWPARSVQSQASSSENVKPPVLLSNPEARVVLGQLYELQSLRVQLIEVRSSEAQELAQYEAEKASWEARIEHERVAYALAVQKTELVQKEVGLLQDQVNFYKSALSVCQSNKKRSKLCTFKKIISAWLWRCK